MTCYDLIGISTLYCHHDWFRMKMLYLAGEIEKRGLYQLLLTPVKKPIIQDNTALIIVMIPCYTQNNIELWDNILEDAVCEPLLFEYGMQYKRPTTKTIYSLIDKPLPKTTYQLYFYYVNGYESEALGIMGKLEGYVYV